MDKNNRISANLNKTLIPRKSVDHLKRTRMLVVIVTIGMQCSLTCNLSQNPLLTPSEELALANKIKAGTLSTGKNDSFKFEAGGKLQEII